jgi:glutamate N-acetyltransferase / amino-acid N-acetyltransferase
MELPPLQEIPNAICAPEGFRAAGVAAGIKTAGPDIALIVSDAPAHAAAVFTTNRVQAAPIQVCREHLSASGGRARAIVVNSGNANACTGARGLEDARRMAALAGAALGFPAQEVLVASTGIIGHPLPMEKLEAGIPAAAAALSRDAGPATAAIMTTDLAPKTAAVQFEIAGRPVRVGGTCKGSGMIGPHLATMLAFLTTDADVWPEVLQPALAGVAARTFNCTTVDGDTSTNDTLAILANCRSGVQVRPGSPALRAFEAALEQVCTELAKALARDGEGATKLIEIRVRGGRTVAEAHRIAMTMANSPLVKTAFFGNDPNWGRLMMAAGRAGVRFDPSRAALWIGDVQLVRAGEPLPFDHAQAVATLKQPEVTTTLELAEGAATARVWTCDFSYDYVRINAEYHT